MCINTLIGTYIFGNVEAIMSEHVRASAERPFRAFNLSNEVIDVMRNFVLLQTKKTQAIELCVQI